MTTNRVIIFMSGFIIAANAHNASISPVVDFWESHRPGELLHSLDQVTADAQLIHAPLILTPPPALHPLSTPVVVVKERVDEENPVEVHRRSGLSKEYDYDKAYEDFVQHYFKRGRDEALNDDSSSVESSEQSYSAEYEPYEDPVTSLSSSISREKCKKVRRNHQECVVCRNPKNNQKSEMCSYSKETEPHSFAFRKEKSFKKHSDSDDEYSNGSDSDDHDDDDDNESEEELKDSESEEEDHKKSKVNRRADRKNKKHGKKSEKGRKKKDVEKRKDSSSCVRKEMKHKVCYFCDDPDGGELVRCLAKASDRSNKNDKRKKSEMQVKKSEKKLYKRMVTYSYENGTKDDGGVVDLTANLAPNTESSRVKSTFVKVLKRKTTLN